MKSEEMRKQINNWKLNKSLLASKIEMSNVTFCNKLKNDSFTEKELLRLKIVLKELYSDLEPIIETDFNDVMKNILNK